jgi:hypothetical protein
MLLLNYFHHFVVGCEIVNADGEVGDVDDAVLAEDELSGWNVSA